MKWPKQLVLIRHAESAFNAMKLKRDADPEYQEFRKLYEEASKKGFQFSKRTVALAQKLRQKYALGVSDSETPLTANGLDQALHTGKGLAQHLLKPDVIFVSPYLRTQQTLLQIMRGHKELRDKVKIVPDERIRERNIGLLELFSDWKILNTLYPEQGQLQRLQGSFYYRYPQGESIVDVQSRNRQWFQTLTRDFSEKVVWAITHHLTILSIRSLLERWTPDQFMDADQNHTPRNCSLTIYRGHCKKGVDGKLLLQDYNKIFY